MTGPPMKDMIESHISLPPMRGDHETDDDAAEGAGNHETHDDPLRPLVTLARRESTTIKQDHGFRPIVRSRDASVTGPMRIAKYPRIDEPEESALVTGYRSS